jgi:RNA recognition motif-containing protein
MNLYIANLNYEVSDSDLRELFSSFGTVTSAKVIMDRETGRSRGFGFVEMSSKEEGQNAINGLNNSTFEGKAISVSEARPRTERPQGNFGNRGGGDRGGYGGGGGYRDRGDRDRRPKW